MNENGNEKQPHPCSEPEAAACGDRASHPQFPGKRERERERKIGEAKPNDMGIDLRRSSSSRLLGGEELNWRRREDAVRTWVGGGGLDPNLGTGRRRRRGRKETLEGKQGRRRSRDGMDWGGGARSGFKAAEDGGAADEDRQREREREMVAAATVGWDGMGWMEALPASWVSSVGPSLPRFSAFEATLF